MKTLSLCMIVRDEEEVIERCLESVGSLPDELIIVDTGSTDRTKELCLSFGAKVFDFEWCDDFAKARNFSFEHATGDYIIWLDADDVIKEAELTKLLELKKKLVQDVYFIKYDYNQNEYGESTCSFYRERILKNNSTSRWIYPVHEVLDYAPDSSSEFLDISITHQRTHQGFEQDRRRNLEILATAVKTPEFSQSPRIWYYLGREYHDHEEFENAIQAYQGFLNFGAEKSWFDDRVAACFRIAQCYVNLSRKDTENQQKNLAQARTNARMAIHLDARWAEAYFVMGEAAFLEKNYEEAAFWFKKCIRPLPDVISPVTTAYYGLLPYVNLMFCYDFLKDFKLANFHNEKALESAPKDAGLLHNRNHYKTLLQASKKTEHTRIAWFGKQLNSDFPTYRIRAIQMNKTLNELGFSSEMIDYQSQMADFDCIVFFKGFNETEYTGMQYALLEGKKVIFDVTEDLLDQTELYPFYIPMLKIADQVICCSHQLAEKVKAYNASVHVVEDSIEFFRSEELPQREHQKLKVAWTGMGENAHHAEKLRPLIEECGYELVSIHNGTDADITWSQENWLKNLLDCDLAIAPLDVEKQPSKSNNKISTYMALGIPVIASPLDAYLRIIKPDVNGFIATTEEEWKNCLKLLKDQTVRKRIGNAGRHSAMRFRPKNIALKLAKILVPEDYNKQSTDIIIPTIYNPYHLRITVESIIACTQVPFNIMVINNGDHTHQLPEEVSIIKGDKLNYAESLNLGIKLGSAPYIGMLNDDLVVTDGWLLPLLASLKNGAAFCNPMSSCGLGITHRNHLEVGGVLFGPDYNELKNDLIYERNSDKPGVNYELIYSYDPPRERRLFRLNWAALYCTITTRTVLEKVGVLDESFGHGHEDVDISFRLNKLGMFCAMNEHSFIFHFGGTSTNKKRMMEPDFPGTAEKIFQEKYGKTLLVIHAGLSFEAWNGLSLEKAGIGGSETAVVKMAESFVKGAYRVIVFCECKDLEERVRGVEYRHLESFSHFIERNVIDVFILSRYAHILEYPVRAVKTYFWSHDICAKTTELGENDLIRKHLNRINGIFCLSNWHKQVFRDYHQIQEEKILLTGNGIELSRFFPETPVQKKKNQFIYTSSPDRGLLVLLSIFPKILEILPDATLHIYYGFENWDKSIRQSGDLSQLKLRDETAALMKQNQVYYHGRVGQDELAKAFLESDIWLYPTAFAETYCITALEAQVSETLCICSDLAALRSTVGDRGILIQEEPNHPDYSRIVLDIITEIQQNPERKRKLLDKAKEWALQQSWESIANSWQAHFEQSTQLN